MYYWTNAYKYYLHVHCTIYLYRTIWRHILFPSRHKPDGNGLTWPQIQYKYDRKKDLQIKLMNPQISQKYNIHELVLDLELINTVNFIFLCVYVIKVVAGLFFCHICTMSTCKQRQLFSNNGSNVKLLSQYQLKHGVIYICHNINSILFWCIIQILLFYYYSTWREVNHSLIKIPLKKIKSHGFCCCWTFEIHEFKNPRNSTFSKKTMKIGTHKKLDIDMSNCSLNTDWNMG
jgi:hypothetical protein